MDRSKIPRGLTRGLLCWTLLASFAWPARSEEEIDVGRSLAGQIKVIMDFAQPIILPVSVFPGFPGYAYGELAFHSTILDEPTNDFFQLSPAAGFRFILLAKDPGMEVLNDHGSGYMGVGESFFIGPAPFDTHPLWNLVTGTPGNSYSLTLKVVDTNGIYSDSDHIVLSFTPEVPPGSGPFSIDITPADPRHVTLSWPTNALDWALESAASVTTTNWTTITNAPGIIGTNFSLSVSNSGGQQFFRLRKP